MVKEILIMLLNDYLDVVWLIYKVGNQQKICFDGMCCLDV